MNLVSLHETVAAAAPIYGVKVGKPDDRATWAIDFKDEATPEQRAAAQAAMDGWTEPVERRKVLKSTVVARLIGAGKIDAAFAALQANKGAFARWFSPDHPAVYADDPDALALLAAIQADPAVIMAP